MSRTIRRKNGGWCYGWYPIEHTLTKITCISGVWNWKRYNKT